MDERWHRIEDLFGQAMELPVSDRAAFLATATAGDQALHDEVASLVASAGDSGTDLRQVVSGAAASLAQGRAATAIGRRLGAYRITELLGEGGMGSVYSAVRDDAMYQQEVAIKLVHRGSWSDEAVARFRDERQILAALEHPGIVRLLDGGATDDGAPYLVMERIVGRTITRYARDEKLDVRGKVALVRQVCDALQYAHRKLIVHRDLKPSNILIDGAGTAKLLDFGIAKLLGPDASLAREASTRTGAMLLTPEYASPEQARGEPVSTATDVYSLGAVLYELLAGRPPQESGGTVIEVIRRICDVEPSAPSALAAALDRDAIAGDLDNIVAKALHKEPERRYGSIVQLADDLDRYTSGLPVLAREATFVYRARKFVRRHRLAVVASCLVVIALSTMTAISIVQARRAREHAMVAERRLEDVRALAHSLLFELDEAIRDVTGTTAARELVVDRALQYLGKVAAERADDDALTLDLATAYMKVGDIQGSPFEASLGRPADAMRSYAAAAALLENLPTTNDEVRAVRLRMSLGLGALHFAERDLTAARQTLEPVLSEIARLAPATLDMQAVARGYTALASLEANNGELTLAERHITEGLAFVTRAPASPRSHYWTGVFLLMRGNEVLSRLGDPDRALADVERGVPLFAALVVDHPDDRAYGRELGYAWLIRGALRSGFGDSRLWFPAIPDASAAEAAFREAIEKIGHQSALDPSSASDKIGVAIAKGSLAESIGRRSPADAIPVFESALATFAEAPESIRTSGQGRENECLVHCAMARVLAIAGRADDARTQATTGLALAEGDVLRAPMCERLVAEMWEALGDQTQERAALDRVVAGLRPLAAREDITPRLGLTTTLQRLAVLDPASACRNLADARAVWSAQKLTTPFVERVLADLDKQRAACPR